MAKVTATTSHAALGVACNAYLVQESSSGDEQQKPSTGDKDSNAREEAKYREAAETRSTFELSLADGLRKFQFINLADVLLVA